MAGPGPGNRSATLIPSELKMVSYNVRGLNKPEKRRRLLRDLALRASVAFLQETHFCSSDPPTLQDHRFPTGYFDHNPESKSKGTAILFASTVPFDMTDTYGAGDGRCLYVKGKIAGSTYTFANLYLPNTKQHVYLAKALRTLESFTEGTLVLGGDFNIPLNPAEDSSSTNQRTPLRILRRIQCSLTALRLVDTWRALNPSVRDYTYYSTVHNTYSRLDYFFVPQYDLPLVRSSEIQATTWSDHAPVVMAMSSPLLRSKERSWRLNTSLLADPLLVADIAESIRTYFTDHLTSAVPQPTIWEAHKAVIRGKLIAWASRTKKARQEETEDLLTKIRQLELEHHSSRDADTYARLLQARTQLTNVMNPRIQSAILQTRCFFALHEDKPGRLLARLLKKQRARAYVPAIRTPKGSVTPHPAQIAQCFLELYSSLYQSADESDRTPEALLEEYLKKRIPYHLSDAQRAQLRVPFTQEEISSAVKTQKNGKAPGPDGLPSMYYKRFGATLVPPLVTTLNSLLENHSLHPHTQAATIVVLPKGGKDPMLCSSYRPISLLNCDLKFFATALAQRLHAVLPLLVQKDQVGFIPAREARDGTTRTLNAIHKARQEEIPMLLLSTDVEKAFDRVSWRFLFATLRAMNLPPEYISWVAALYGSPNARVRVNGILSDTFQIRNGTRQGCPLSPILFALTLEPFLESVRRNEAITGLEGGSGTHKVSAYADDMLFYVTNPLASLPEIVEEFSVYSKLSNLKLNLEKSEILSLNIPGKTERALQRKHPFHWCPKKMRYLGIWLTKSPQDLYQENFVPLWSELGHDLGEWNLLKISWLGRIGVLKMNVLPRLLYLFQTLPIHIPPAFFQRIRSDCNRFVWRKAKPRISLRTLTRPKSSGGLALPDFRLYYEASHLQRIVEWTTGGRHALWQDLERDATPHPTPALPWIAADQRSPVSFRHPFVGATLRVWRSANRRYLISSYPHLCCLSRPTQPSRLACTPPLVGEWDRTYCSGRYTLRTERTCAHHGTGRHLLPLRLSWNALISIKSLITCFHYRPATD
uniref:Reverse transcriptase domain-containing protein n=1 Tax=Leptobrachium leishanense TaxID=445787 RepID=A0A8C5Q4M0_9ANUR